MPIIKKSNEKKAARIVQPPVTEEFKVKVPSDGNATVMLSKSITLKVGDYEFVKFDAGLIVNTDDTDDEINYQLERISGIIDEFLEEQVDALDR